MAYDIIIIGAGWAGYNAAVKAKELGLKAVIVESDKLGGTCLNRGCIPTKTLIQSVKILNLVKKASVFGVESRAPALNYSRIQLRKAKIIEQLTKGMEFMLKGVDFIKAPAKVISSGVVEAGGDKLTCKNIVIATGSVPVELKNLKFDHSKIISSDDLLSFKELPQSLLIIGGGVIGCEFASLMSSLGVEVSIFEKMPQLLPGEDREIARKIETVFKKKGIKANTSKEATDEDMSRYEKVLLCVGRRPYSAGLGLKEAGIMLDEQGRVLVDDYLKTNVPGIFAAGDCTGKVMLAHYAAYEGRIAALNAANENSPQSIKGAIVPSCIFSDPEIGSCGLKEEEALASGRQVRVTKFDFMGSGMARIMDEAEGFIKIISDKEGGAVLGAFIIGPKATELIATLNMAVTLRLKISDLKKVIFAHPSLSESIAEAL